jgi:hypothetical protein
MRNEKHMHTLARTFSITLLSFLVLLQFMIESFEILKKNEIN